ncbi:MAG: cytochrome c maturation protein CcmE [Janthinobacterium lividum]
MYKSSKNKLVNISLYMFLGFAGVFFILAGLRDNIVFFYPPSELHKVDPKKLVRVGGLVKKGSIDRNNNLETEFVLTDNIAEVKVYFKGVTPALFREEQGIVASGTFTNNLFIARELITKHDENYMPPNDKKKVEMKLPK